MDYKTLFSDISVANELLFAEDDEKGCIKKPRLVAYDRISVLQHLFVIWNGWKGPFKDKWLVLYVVKQTVL